MILRELGGGLYYGEPRKDEGDRAYNTMVYSDHEVSRLTRTLVPFDERSLIAALGALDRLQAGGGTEMVHAIQEAMALAHDDAQRQVVLVTDGQIGFESEVVGRVAARHNVRLHVVGVGHAPNRALTQQAAAAGRGLELLVATHDGVHEAAHRLVAGTASPVLTQLAVGGTALAGHKPSRLRDVFAGQPLVFTVELSAAGGTFELRGAQAGARDAWARRIRCQRARAHWRPRRSRSVRSTGARSSASWSFRAPIRDG
jgi:Ca-activated chloride channel family protein